MGEARVSSTAASPQSPLAEQGRTADCNEETRLSVTMSLETRASIDTRTGTELSEAGEQCTRT
jgi:hypothetical protein